MDNRHWKAWLLGWINKDRHGCELATTDLQMMLVRLLYWAHQQPMAWPISTERNLHNNDCSTLPENSACTTTIYLSWIGLYSEVIMHCMNKHVNQQTQGLPTPPPTHTSQLYSPINPKHDLWDCVQSYNAEYKLTLDNNILQRLSNFNAFNYFTDTLQ